MNVDTLINKYYSDPAELEKMAQIEKQRRSEVSAAEKVANEAGYDISGMTDEEKIQLYQALSAQLAQLEQQGQGDPSLGAARQDTPDVSAVSAQAQPQAQEAPVSPEFQMKVAENMYFGEQFGEVAAYKFAETVLPILEEMRKLASLFGEKTEKKKEEEKKEDSAFESLAKEKAEEMKKEAEKKQAFDLLVEKRAREILAGV